MICIDKIIPVRIQWSVFTENSVSAVRFTHYKTRHITRCNSHLEAGRVFYKKLLATFGQCLPCP